MILRSEDQDYCHYYDPLEISYSNIDKAELRDANLLRMDQNESIDVEDENKYFGWKGSILHFVSTGCVHESVIIEKNVFPGILLKDHKYIATWQPFTKYCIQ